MTEWLDKLHAASDKIHGEVDHLHELGRALKRVGNKQLANELYGISFILTEVEADILKSANLKVSQDVKGANEMTGTIFNAIVAGGIMEKRRKVRK